MRTARPPMGSGDSESDEESAPQNPRTSPPPPPEGKKKAVYVDLSQCKHDIVREAAVAVGWQPCAPDAYFHIFWTDLSVSPERVMRLHSAGRRINHFPAIDMICRKVPLAINLGRMRKLHPADFNFLPLTFTDHRSFLAHKASSFDPNKQSKRKQFYIVKPSNGCMGKGIFLTSNPDGKMFQNSVVQEYIDNPLTIDSCKFDLRCYVILLSVCPTARLFLFNEGLVRMCAEEYVPPDEANISQTCIHITNYAVNKKSEKFIPNEGGSGGATLGHKRNFAFLNQWLRRGGTDPDVVWASISDLIVKTFLSISTMLAQAYRSCAVTEDDLGLSCFELLGFDILLDESLKPHLMEVNHSPSLACDSQLDYDIKKAVLTELMTLVDPLAFPRGKPPSIADYRGRRRFARQRTEFEDSVLKGFKRIFPCKDRQETNRYLAFIPHAPSTQSTFHCVARRGGTAPAKQAKKKAPEQMVPRTPPNVSPRRSEPRRKSEPPLRGEDLSYLNAELDMDLDSMIYTLERQLNEKPAQDTSSRLFTATPHKALVPLTRRITSTTDQDSRFYSSPLVTAKRSPYLTPVVPLSSLRRAPARSSDRVRKIVSSAECASEVKWSLLQRLHKVD